MFFHTVSTGTWMLSKCVCVYLQVYVLSLVSSWWVETSDGLTIKRLCLWRLWLPVWCLHLSCYYRTVVKTSGSTPANQSHLSSLLHSPPVCLFLACSHSMPAPAGLRDQEPGLPWQLVLSLSLDGSSLNCVPRHLQLPTTHTQKRHIS